MTKVSLQIILDHAGSPFYTDTYEVSDGNQLIYESYLAVCPKIRTNYETFLLNVFKGNEDETTVNLEIVLKEDKGPLGEMMPIYDYIVTGMTGKKSRIYGPLCGANNIAFEELKALLKANYG